MQTLFFTNKVIARLPFIFVLSNTSPDVNSLLRLVLNNASNPNYLLPEISRLVLVMAINRTTIFMVIWRMPRRTSRSATIAARPLIGLAIDFKLNLL